MRLYDDVPLRKICKSWFDANGSTASKSAVADSCQFILCVGFKVLDYYTAFSLPVCFYDNMSRLLLRAARQAATLILTRSRGYIYVLRSQSRFFSSRGQ